MSTRREHVEIIELNPLCRPLLDKFYKDQRSAMRSVGDGRWWVARDGEIVAGLSLSQVGNGAWLTGLLVQSSLRGKGIGRRLINAAQRDTGSTLWLFCNPDLVGFYQHLGFEPAINLPVLLQHKLARYQASKPLLAMQRVSRPALDRAPETALR